MKRFLFFLFFLIAGIYSCKKEVPTSYLTNHNFPPDVRDIFLLKCATSGCHNTKSKEAASGLDLSSWNKLFEGGNNGSAIIPYRSDHSFLVSFINTYSDLGPSLQPQMPLNMPALSHEEVESIVNWIHNGAPDASGFVKFSDNNKRKKIYVVNQGCDLVAVYDAETNLIMRYVNVGINPGVIESPHTVKISPDGQYWYVVFYNGTVMQRFFTYDDSPAGQVVIGPGFWNTITFTSDSKIACCVNWSGSGSVAKVDLESMTLLETWRSQNLFVWPHGSAFGPNNDTLYLTAQYGNYIYKVPLDDPSSVEKVYLESTPSMNSALDPHELAFTPDNKKYFVTCQKSNEVRVFQTSNDSLLAIIPVGNYPQELAVSKNANYVYVTCTDDTTFNTSGHGSVAVIDYQSNTLVKKIFTGIQPHGIAIDEKNRRVYVANRNVLTNGPAPHHSSVCGGRNGYITIIDMNTLELLPFRSEVSVDPYSVAVRE